MKYSIDLERMVTMPNILPVSDLRNYNEVLKNCQVGEPVFLTKNGRGRFVVMDIKDYIAEDNVDKALETIQEIYRQFENIQQFPYIGADLSKRVSFKTDYKYVVWQDYVVLYKVVKEAVEIYRVVNRYQDITRIFE